jgi:hypothetical protein
MERLLLPRVQVIVSNWLAQRSRFRLVDGAIEEVRSGMERLLLPRVQVSVSESDLELDPNSWQSALRIAKSVLQIAISVVAFATGLPKFYVYNKLRNCQACVAFRSQIFTSGFSNPQYEHFPCGNPQSSRRGLPRSALHI